MIIQNKDRRSSSTPAPVMTHVVLNRMTIDTNLIFSKMKFHLPMFKLCIDYYDYYNHVHELKDWEFNDIVGVLTNLFYDFIDVHKIYKITPTTVEFIADSMKVLEKSLLHDICSVIMIQVGRLNKDQVVTDHFKFLSDKLNLCKTRKEECGVLDMVVNIARMFGDFVPTRTYMPFILWKLKKKDYVKHPTIQKVI